MKTNTISHGTAARDTLLETAPRFNGNQTLSGIGQNQVGTCQQVRASNPLGKPRGLVQWTISTIPHPEVQSTPR